MGIACRGLATGSFHVAAYVRHRTEATQQKPQVARSRIQEDQT